MFSLYLFLVWRLRLYSAALLALGCVAYLLRRDIFLREDNRLCYYSWLAVSKECLLSIWYSRKTRKGWSISLDQAWNLKNKPLQWKYFGATKALQFHVIAVSTHHYSDVIMGVMASQITSLTIVYSTFYSGAIKETSKLRVTGLCVGNSPVTGELPAQITGNAENVSIWWCHHDGDGGWIEIYCLSIWRIYIGRLTQTGVFE